MVASTRRRRASPKARLPTKEMRSTSTLRASSTSNTRSTRLSERRMMRGVTETETRPDWA